MPSTTLVVARRELTEKRFVFIAAIAFALLAVITSLVVNVRGSFAEMLALTSAIFATAFALGLASILGATLIGRELTENRLSFYFARPLPGTALWFGKLAAAMILIVVSFGIIFFPAAMTGTHIVTMWTNSLGMFAAAVIAGAIILFLVVHIVSTMVRSRSAWIGLDFVCAIATAAAAAGMLILPLMASAWTIFLTAAIALATGVLIVVIGASAWQVAMGRTDRRRNHLALSRFLWSGVTVVLVLVATYLLWVMTVTPADFVEIRARRDGHAGWEMISGHARWRGDYEPAFLVNADGRRTRILAPYWTDVEISRDGRMAVWQRYSIFEHSMELVRCRLDVPRPSAERTSLWIPRSELALSDDGTRVVTGTDTFNVYDVHTLRNLGSFHVDVPEKSWPRISFVGNDVVRVYVRDFVRNTANILEYDLRTRTLSRTGSSEAMVVALSPDRSRMLAFRNRAYVLADARTGAKLASPSGHSIHFLADGSVAMLETFNGKVTISRLDASGNRLPDVVVAGRYYAAELLGGDARRILLRGKVDTREPWLVVVDLQRGVVLRQDPELENALIDRDRPLPDEILALAGPRLMAWNLVTGAKRLGR